MTRRMCQPNRNDGWAQSFFGYIYFVCALHVHTHTQATAATAFQARAEYFKCGGCDEFCWNKIKRCVIQHATDMLDTTSGGEQHKLSAHILSGFRRQSFARSLDRSLPQSAARQLGVAQTTYMIHAQCTNLLVCEGCHTTSATARDG